MKECAVVVGVDAKKGIGKVQILKHVYNVVAARRRLERLLQELHCAVFLGLIGKYTEFVDRVHAEVHSFVLHDHQHKSASGLPINEMSVILTQIQVFKTDELGLVLLEEVVAQSQLFRTVDQFD